MLPEGIKGLTLHAAREKLKEFGPNVLPEKPPPSDLVIFVSQLKNPLVYILLFAGIVTFLLDHVSDSLIIFVAVLINTILGYFQERKAEKTLRALKKLIQPQAAVLREGKIKKIDITKVVPGDICALNQGDKIPADGILVFANRFFVSEAILTGESFPVEKREEEKVFMGTVVTAGKGFVRATQTGKATEIGKIALQIQEPEVATPLKRQLKRLSSQLSYLVLGLTIFVFAVGLSSQKALVEIFSISVALAVSAIPEGLLVGLTVVLAIGMQRILKRNGLVRRMVSAETLGGVTTICIDKTGTLTQGRMEVAEAIGNSKEIAEQVAIANDLDDPLVIAAFEWAQEKLEDHQSLISSHKRLDSIPFSPKDRFFASLNRWEGDANIVFVNGAPEFLLEWTNLSEEDKRKIRLEIEDLTSQGKRLVGLGRKVVSSSKKKLDGSDVKKDLEWVGLISFWDPVRPGVAEALQKTKTAGINLIVITGDFAQTAVSIMSELGETIKKDEILEGNQLENLSLDEFSEKVRKVKLFARTTPNQKLKIVEALKKNGEVVAMMGDGVNDAPALNNADIGIVVGDSSDVAKESADLVLLDSNFATIVAAVEEGRGIFENIRKIILYLMSDSFEEIIAVVAALLFGLPLPVFAAQILWINLVSDGFPDLALTVDPKRSDLMTEPPRSPKEAIVASWMKILILIVSFAGGISAFFLFYLTYKNTSDITLARSTAFAALGINSLVYVFSIRTLKKPFWKNGIFDNKWLILAVFGGVFLQIAPFIFTGLGEFLSVVPLGAVRWLLVFATSILMFIIIEVAKALFKFKLR